LIDNQFFQIGL